MLPLPLLHERAGYRMRPRTNPVPSPLSQKGIIEAGDASRGAISAEAHDQPTKQGHESSCERLAASNRPAPLLPSWMGRMGIHRHHRLFVPRLSHAYHRYLRLLLGLCAPTVRHQILPHPSLSRLIGSE